MAQYKQKRTFKNKWMKLTRRTNRKTGVVKSLIEIFKPKKRKPRKS